MPQPLYTEQLTEGVSMPGLSFEEGTSVHSVLLWKVGQGSEGGNYREADFCCNLRMNFQTLELSNQETICLVK